jgi:hypothetical protein
MNDQEAGRGFDQILERGLCFGVVTGVEDSAAEDCAGKLFPHGWQGDDYGLGHVFFL